MRAQVVIPVLVSILILGTLGLSQNAYAPPFNEVAKLTASDAAVGDQFGTSVSISGDTAIVGAQGNDDAGSFSGSAYVFVRSGTTWTEQAKLTASDPVTLDFFGFSVSISGDTAIVGASGSLFGSGPGFAYVFVRSGTTWTEQAKLTASDAAAGDFFGFSVSISGDTAIVGAHGNDDTGSRSGSAYVFVRSGTTWTEQAKLTASDPATLDDFGFSVSLSGDRAIVGARLDDDAGGNSGSVYIFDFDGTSWTQTKLTASDATAGDQFGRSVSISGDRAIVGALLDDDAGGNSGSAYIFDFDGTSWTQTKLTASDAAADDLFGIRVSISGDRAIVGAFFDDDAGGNSGSTYIFDFDGTSWTQTKLTASDATAGDIFGRSVSLSGDSAIVGAPLDDDAGSFSGSAYVFDLSKVEICHKGNKTITVSENAISVHLKQGDTLGPCPE